MIIMIIVIGSVYIPPLAHSSYPNWRQNSEVFIYLFAS
jgi:hypothetical protein